MKFYFGKGNNFCEFAPRFILIRKIILCFSDKFVKKWVKKWVISKVKHLGPLENLGAANWAPVFDIFVLDINCQLGNICWLNLYIGIGYILPIIGGYILPTIGEHMSIRKKQNFFGAPEKIARFFTQKLSG